jgi:Rap1a immunity proteins
MRCINVIVMGLILLLTEASANAEEIRGDGNELLRYCTDSSPADSVGIAKSAWCSGYLLGIDDMRKFSATLPHRPTDCMPEGVTMVQVKRVVVDYLQEHPEELRYSSVVLVHNALKHAFPCLAQPAPQ